jgi:hypothetical protein
MWTPTGASIIQSTGGTLAYPAHCTPALASSPILSQLAYGLTASSILIWKESLVEVSSFLTAVLRSRRMVLCAGCSRGEPWS